ncbi:hypothetical protein EB118_01960 [bacterium]|nr:hypothetical protein [bacterium]NDC94182.1 hypothetical protein [bacterium]NDD83014.1 hypothetical protein [bacterium]NDG28852.1 hypothetical protein [bacterium]
MNLTEYIKSKYPGMVKDISSDSTVGFILNKSSVGVLDGDGNIKTLGDIHEVEMLLKSDFKKITDKIPVVEPLGDTDLDTVTLNAEKVSPEMAKKIISSLKMSLKQSTKPPQAVFLASGQPIVVDSQNAERVRALSQKYDTLRSCVDTIVSQKALIVSRIKDYNRKMEEYIRSNAVNYTSLKTLYMGVKSENETLRRQLQEVQNTFVNTPIYTGTTTDTTTTGTADTVDKQKLLDAINTIQNELLRSRDLFKQAQVKALAMQAHYQKCAQTVLSQKEAIIQKIKEYNGIYANWANGLRSELIDVQAHRNKLLAELKQVTDLLEASKSANVSASESIQLRQALSDIRKQLTKTVADNLIQLNIRDREIQRLNDLSNTQSANYNSQIARLKRELESVKELLSKNDTTAVPQPDFENCYAVVKAFCALNNVFFRKQEIIKKLDAVINSNAGEFSGLSETVKNSVRTQFEAVKTGINRHIDFLDLKKYITDARCRQNLELFKSDILKDRVPKSFCDELFALLRYWDTNKVEYRDQDRILTNIYEDLSGAVRVYIRIKPLLGLEQRNRTVSIESNGGIQQKRVKITCGTREESFGEFYGVFDQSFTNKDVYTGIENSESVVTALDNSATHIDVDSIVQSQDTVSPGLWSTIRQVEDGYSVVIFGYGASGSGKTMTLLGNGKIPGLIHFARSNLRGVRSFKLKYLFEQYYSLINFNFKKITGKIHTLVGKIPQLEQFTYAENNQFAADLKSAIDLDDIKESDLFGLTRITDNYRKRNLRVAKTPNNPESSRSHLYMVFEVTFENDTRGYITFVDTAGRESPTDIFNTFIDSTKTTIESVLAPSGGEQLIAKHARPEIASEYTPKEILGVLKQGVYINETINHMVYYFNKKNYRESPITMQSDTGGYTTSKFFVDPRSELRKVSESNNALTIPILQFLDNLSNRSKGDANYRPTKFVTIIALRQELKYCDQTFESMQFAQSIKST